MSKKCLNAFSLFAILLLFSNPVLAIPGSALLKAVKILYEKSNRNFHLQSVLDLKESGNLYSEVNNEWSRILKVAGDNGDIAYLSDENEVVFKAWLDISWLEGNKDIFLEFWDREAMRSIIVDFIRIEHLTGNPKLLLKWWEEIRFKAGSVENGFNKFEEFLFFTYKKYEPWHIYGYHPSFSSDPFWLTALNAVRESKDFAKSLRETLIKIDEVLLSSHIGTIDHIDMYPIFNVN